MGLFSLRSVIGIMNGKMNRLSKFVINFNKSRLLYIAISFASASLLVACTKTCVGLPEIGSKHRPVRFYMDGWAHKDESLEPFRILSDCLEASTGYRFSFEIAADEKAVASALARGEAQLGQMSALGYLEARSRYPIDSLLVVSEKGAPSTRSVVLGRAARWRVSLRSLGISLTTNGLKSEDALSPIDGQRFGYVSPESDVGFFVPRQMLFQRGVFPGEAIFAGNFSLILQALQRDIVIAGAVSETFVEKNWPQAIPVQPGAQVGDFVVLAVSQGLPGRVVVARREIPQKITLSAQAGLDQCSKGTGQANIRKIFQGDGFYKSHEKMFEFIKQLLDFQHEHVRVLSPQEQ